MLDAASEARLGGLHPEFQSRYREGAAILEQEGIPIRLVQGGRSWDEQAKIYAQGRFTPGPIVSNAPPGHSWHEYFMAGDAAPIEYLSLPDWGAGKPHWTRYVEVMEGVGLVCGAHWHHPDVPHLQFTGHFPVSPTDEVRELFKAGGQKAVWDAA